MNAADAFQWIVIGGAIFLVILLFLWSLCSIAKLSDESSERYWRENYETEKLEDEIQKNSGN